MIPKIGICIDRYQIKFGLIRALEIAKEIGADAVDIMINHEGYESNSINNPNSIYSKGDEAIIAYYTKAKEKADELGMEIYQTHGRMLGYTLDEAHNQLTLANARIDCMVTAVLGAKYCVMHGPSRHKIGKDAQNEVLRELNYKMFQDVIPHALRHGIFVASESLGEDSDEFFYKYGMLQNIPGADKALAICLDVGHTNVGIQGKGITVGDVIRQYGTNVGCLHLHDNNGLKDQHKMPGMGDIDWKDLVDALKEVEYQGVYNLELALEKFGWDLIIPHGKFAIEAFMGMVL